jgi:hypothetical protein
MTKHKIQNKHKAQIPNVKTLVLIFVIWVLDLFCALNFDIYHLSFAQDSELEFTLDITSNTVPLPKIFKPNIDLSGRGFHRQVSWPQTLAAEEVLNIWGKDIGFSGLFRMQYSLWEISQLAKDKESQNKLLNNYENIFKNITDAGGIVILDIFGTPAGLGKVLDKRIPPQDLKAFKELIKNTIQNLSCQKRYNIWYEIWNAPDLDDFFLGRKQDYLNLYRQTAAVIKELEAKTKVHIPLGGPSVTWWFQNFDGNNILTPERSFIYELIKFCYSYRLPLDFITWHGYTTDPRVESENTRYKKTAAGLIRDWLSYFNFDRNTPLIVDEWNFDRDANVLPEREENSYICASYIPSRINNMYKAGIDYQIYFSLEDFQNNKEAVTRNVGIFSFDPERTEYKGAPKSIYNVFRMLANLGTNMFLQKPEDEFVGVIATKSQEDIALLIYNYIDPEIVTNFLSKDIATLNDAERKFLLNLIKQDKLEKIMLGQLDISKLRTSNRTKTILKKTFELNNQAKKFQTQARNMKINIKNLKSDQYLYQRYTVDSSCSLNCGFVPAQEKEINPTQVYQEELTLKPYSAHLIILKLKPRQASLTDTVKNKDSDAEQKK